MGIARSTYYDAPKRAADDTALVEAMDAIKDEFEVYGWRHLSGRYRASRYLSAKRGSAKENALKQCSGSENKKEENQSCAGLPE